MSERRILIDAYWDSDNINFRFDRVVSLGMLNVSGLMDNSRITDWLYGVVKTLRLQIHKHRDNCLINHHDEDNIFQ